MLTVMNSKKVYQWLEKIDKELAAQAGAAACEHCGGTLHRGNYQRKPRGGVAVVVECWDRRYSFCCSQEGCRKRKTPPSVRFLGRKVYAGVVVVLVAAMMHGPSARRAAQLHDALGIDIRTLKRWRQWWLDFFVCTPFWKAGRGRFMPVLDEGQMPFCLVQAFGGDDRTGVIKLMEFLAPISTGTWKEVVAM